MKIYPWYLYGVPMQIYLPVNYHVKPKKKIKKVDPVTPSQRSRNDLKNRNKDSRSLDIKA